MLAYFLIIFRHTFQIMLSKGGKGVKDQQVHMIPGFSYVCFSVSF